MTGEQQGRARRARRIGQRVARAVRTIVARASDAVRASRPPWQQHEERTDESVRGRERRRD